jgi:hypothetical protein
MILAIINIICLLLIIGIILYIIMTYVNIKTDIVKLQKIVPEEGTIINKLKDMTVPSGPGPSPTPSPSPPGPGPSPSPSPSPSPYVPPNEAMKTYYTVIKAALDTFEREKTAIINMIGSQDFYSAKGDVASKYLKENKTMIPIIAWYVYENSPAKSSLNQKDINDMFTVLNFYNNDAYKYTSANGNTYHFSTLAVSSSIQQFYQNNKTYIETCLRDGTC